jgi:hypothetical protein
LVTEARLFFSVIHLSFFGCVHPYCY